MRRLLFAAVATAIFALLPTLALAQRIPGPVKETVAVIEPTITTRTLRVLQTIPVTPTNAGLPAGITDTATCLGPGATSFVPIRFVGNILCLDPGTSGDFRAWAVDCPAGTTPVVQGVKLIKTVPRSPKCPDVYPGGTWTMTPVTTGIRTWWPLKYTPAGTTFQLRIEYACLRPAAGGRTQVVSPIREAVYNFSVVVTADTLSWLIHALHNQPLGVTELPCITDESVFALLLTQADAVRTAAAGLPGTTLALNTAIDRIESTIIARCLFLISVAQVTRDAAGNITAVLPNTLFPNGGPWGNFTVTDFGWGIVDTLEHPCCCKLITDLYWLKNVLIGNNDP